MEKKPLKVERRYTVRRSWVRGSVQAGAARHLMRWQKYWERALLSGVDAVGGVAQQDFTDSDKVHHLGYAEERGDDQRAATGPLEECTRTLLCQDLPAVGERRRGVAAPCYSHHEYVSNQYTSFLPGTVHHSVIGLLVSAFFEWLQPCLYHWRRQTWLIIIINSSSSSSRSILACNSSSDLRFSVLSLLSIVSVINVYKIPKEPQSLTQHRNLIPNSTCPRLQKAFIWVLHTKHRPPSPSQGLTATAATHPAKQPDVKDQ